MYFSHLTLHFVCKNFVLMEMWEDKLEVSNNISTDLVWCFFRGWYHVQAVQTVMVTGVGFWDDWKDAGSSRGDSE